MPQKIGQPAIGQWGKSPVSQDFGAFGEAPKPSQNHIFVEKGGTANITKMVSKMACSCSILQPSLHTVHLLLPFCQDLQKTAGEAAMSATS